MTGSDAAYRFEPIGFVRSPFAERVQAPRQASVGREVRGRIELVAGRGYDHALEGLAAWEYVWIVFVFHRNVEQGRGWKAKVLPPRSRTKQGVFATRSPHRPNPIGLSAALIERVEGLVVHVRGLDLLDGTPVLDLKPYVAYADAIPGARAGWLEVSDPLPPWQVAFSDAARAQLDWLAGHGVDLQTSIEATLALGPEPKPYRRIRERDGALELAIKDWRVGFAVEAPAQARAVDGPRPGRLEVTGVRSGYRPKDLATRAGVQLHHQFAHAFPASGR